MKSSVYRRDKILEHLRIHTFVSVSQLAQELGCSQMTVRRDLKRFESEGLLDISHGGAVATDKVRLEFSLAERSTSNVNEKNAIGRAAVELVSSGDSVILGTGTTTLAMARQLRHRNNITVVTTSLAVVAALLPAEGVECMLLGGLVRDSSPDLYGPLLEENLERIRPVWAFIGCDGLSLEAGLTASDPRIARAPSIMLNNASRTALLVDSTKAASDAFISFARLKDIDYLITDKGMPSEIVDAAADCGIEVLLVDPGLSSAESCGG